jgi:WD40 repeat protein
MIEIHSNIVEEDGVWSLVGLNSRLRFCRYAEQQYFHRHLDGVYYRSEIEQSKLTFMVYLNSATEFEGGRTLFYKSKENEEIWAEYIPKKGDLIVFDHNVWHEGEVLKSGEKYILRSDIIYSKQISTREKQPFTGHLGYIWKLLKLDESTLVSGGRDKLIHIWNAEGQLLQTLQGHENSILCIEKLNESTIISGSRDQKIIVWRKGADHKFERVQTIAIHTALLLSLCRLTDTTFASGGGDGVLKICDSNGQVLKSFSEHHNWIWQIVSLTEKVIATVSEDCTIKIWDIDLEHSIQTFKTEAPNLSLEYQKDQRRLISGDLNGNITVTTLTHDFEKSEVFTFKAHHGIIRTLKSISDHLLASGGEDNKVKVWDLRCRACVLEHKHQNFVQSLELWNKHLLLSASYDGTIQKIDLKDIEA